MELIIETMLEEKFRRVPSKYTRRGEGSLNKLIKHIYLTLPFLSNECHENNGSMIDSCSESLEVAFNIKFVFCRTLSI